MQVEAATVQQAVTVDHTSALTEFEKRDLEIKEKHLALVEENRKKSEEAERTKVETERIKANAVAQSKYDEILTVSNELDEVLDKVTDWKNATRGEVISAMKSLESWSHKYNDLNRAHREFTIATAEYLLPFETTRVNDLIGETTNKYEEVTAAIREEDEVRELYSLAGAGSEQVKLPRFSGATGEDFSIFKSKLLLALEKNRVPASDKVEKLRSCLSGQALALVPENAKDFSAALEVLADAFRDPKKVLA